MCADEKITVVHIPSVRFPPFLSLSLCFPIYFENWIIQIRLFELKVAQSEKKNHTHKSLAKIKLVCNTLNGTCLYSNWFFATFKSFQKWYAKYQMMFAICSFVRTLCCCCVWFWANTELVLIQTSRICAENQIQFLWPISELNWLKNVFAFTYNNPLICNLLQIISKSMLFHANPFRFEKRRYNYFCEYIYDTFWFALCQLEYSK